MIPRASQLNSFTDVFGDEATQENISPPISLPSSLDTILCSPTVDVITNYTKPNRPLKHTGQHGQFRSVEEIDPKYRSLFTYPYFNLVQSRIIEDALYSDKSLVLCAPTGSGKTVAFELAILQLLMQNEDTQYADFKIIYMAPVKAVCNERLTEWYPKLTKLGLLCIEVTGDTEVDFTQLKPYKVIITTPEKWDMLTRRWRDHRGLVEMIKLFLIDEVHILNDETRGPVLEAVVSRMKTIESAALSAHRIEQLQKQYQGFEGSVQAAPPRIRFVAVSATISNPEDVADWLGTNEKPAVFHKFGDECRPVRLKRIVEGYPCAEGTSIFKFDLILNYKLWSIIQKYYNGKPTLIFCNTRKSVALTAEALSREITVTFSPEQKAKLTALASSLKNKKLQMLVMSGVGCHHAGLLYEERVNIERAFRERDLPILITTTTLAMGVNLPAHLVIIKNTQQYVNGAYQEYSISTVLQMVGRAGRPQFDTEATAVIMTRLSDKPRYQSLVGGSEPLQSYLHKRIAENLNSEAALGTVTDVAQCVEWLRSTFLYVRAAKDPKRYLGLPNEAPMHLILKKIEELCVKAMNGLASSGLITMDDACCIESTEAGRLMSVFYLDVETMKNIMKIDGTETLDRLLWLVCESHELSDMHLRMDERRCLNLLNRNNAAATIRFPMKGKISTRQMKLSCIIQAVLGCLPIPDPSLNQEAMKVMRIAARVCTCLVKYVSRPELVNQRPQYFSAVLNSILLAKCMESHIWETSPYVSKQLKGIGPTFSTLLASAGKTSFMVLEESHPRDLERIMNKGPPAGNVIRKQVSLLPKYQLTATPRDLQTISVQLILLNHAHLSENMDHLTAGNGHKSYLLVGDSENHLLLLVPFSDKDFISVYNGTMTYEITRKLSKEHKIMIHCISSSIVGIDAQAEYVFQSLEPEIPNESDYFALPQGTPKKNTARKQSTITDTFKERKRRNNNDLDITQSKEKKKRETALTEKLKALKESFGRKTKEIKKDIDKSTNLSCKLLSELLEKHEAPAAAGNVQNISATKVTAPTVDLTADVAKPWEDITIDCDDYDYIDDVHINSILNKIETEINGKDPTSNLKSGQEITFQAESVTSHFNMNTIEPNKLLSNNSPKAVNTAVRFPIIKDTRKRKNVQPKSNYSVIDKIARKASTEDAENVEQTNSGFSETIKSYISKFLEHAQHLNVPTAGVNEVIHKVEEDLPSVYVKQNSNSCDKIEQNDNINVIEPVEQNQENVESNEIGILTNENMKDVIDEEPCRLQKDNEGDIELLKNTIEMITKDDEANEKIRNTNFEHDMHISITDVEIDNEIEVNSTKHQDSQADTQNQTILYKSENTSDIVNEQHRNEIPSTVNRATRNVRKFLVSYRSQNNSVPITTNATNSSIQNEINTIEVENNLNSNNENALVPITKSRIEIKNVEVITSNTGNITHAAKTLDSNQFEGALVPATKFYSILDEPNNANESTYITENKADHRDNKPNCSNSEYTKAICSQVKQKAAHNMLVPLNNALRFNSTESCYNTYNHTKHDTERKADEADDQNSIFPYRAESDNMENDTKNHNALNGDLVITDKTLVVQSKELNERLPLSQIEKPAVDINPYNPHHNASFYQNKHFLNAKNAISRQRNIYDSTRNTTDSNNQKKTHFNRYFYTATKVNVCTKNTPDHQVRITRKLKVDVDITEIVREEKNKTNNSANLKKENIDNFSNIQNVLNKKTGNHSGFERKFENNARILTGNAKGKMNDCIELVTKLSNKKQPHDDDINEEEPVNFTSEKNIDNMNIIDNIQKGTRTGICCNDGYEGKFENNPLVLTDARNKTTDELEVTNDKEQRNSDNNSGEPVNYATEKNIGNILQKYSKLLVKSETNAPFINKMNKNGNETIKSESQLNTVKSRRPFKIRDIQNIDVPLPSTITEVTSAKLDTTVPLPHIEHTDKKNIVEYESGLRDVNLQPCTMLNSYSTTDTRERSPTIESPVSIRSLELEPEENMEDDNMLNPKRLLQYFSTDNNEADLIPPPAEFVENLSSYSPNATHEFYDSHESTSNFNIPCSYADESTNNGTDFENYDAESPREHGNNFENSYDSRMAESQKDTWFLSRDENDRESQPVSAPWIISQTIGTGLQSRRARLGQFKFVRKKPLQPR